MSAKRLSKFAWVLLLTGCATAYQPMGPTGGYKDREIGPGKYELFFLGNGLTSADQVEKYWHQRAAELCKNGYKHSYAGSREYTVHSTASTGGVMTIPIVVNTPQLLGIIECTTQ